MRAQAAMQLDAIAQQHREEAAQAELRRQEDQALFETKLSTAISMSAHVTQTISQQVNNLTQLITGLSLPAPPRRQLMSRQTLLSPPQSVQPGSLASSNCAATHGEYSTQLTNTFPHHLGTTSYWQKFAMNSVAAWLET